MLTKNDLNQIRSIVHNEVDETVEKKLDPLTRRMGGVEGKIGSLSTRMESFEGKMENLSTRMGGVEGKIGSLSTRMEGFEGKMSGLSTRMEGVEKEVKSLKKIKKDISYIKKTVNLVIGNYDDADVKLDRRVKRLEEHAGFLTL